jgi:hypothetical protein
MVVRGGLAWYGGSQPVISVLGRLRQEDCEFQDSLGYIATPCFQKT